MVLFPTSSREPLFTNPDRNESLIQEYKKKYEKWYPFYLSDCEMYVDDHHLQIF